MTTVILILICIITLLFAGLAFYIASKETRERKELEKEIEERTEYAKQQQEATAQANQTKADARTGDHERDLNFMADKLHEYAKK